MAFGEPDGSPPGTHPAPTAGDRAPFDDAITVSSSVRLPLGLTLAARQLSRKTMRCWNVPPGSVRTRAMEAPRIPHGPPPRSLPRDWGALR